jgi:hypothetical protein
LCQIKCPRGAVVQNGLKGRVLGVAKFIRRHRSFKKIERVDLTRLADLALGDLHSLFTRKPKTGVYAKRLMLLCLCQGAAQHYVYSDRGINDFDVWAFFRLHSKHGFPYRWHGRIDFGPSRFGRTKDDKARFTGRRIDVFGRSIPVLKTEKPIDAVQRYLHQAPRGSRSSPWHLAQRPVVIIWPKSMRGRVIWKGAENIKDD